MPVTVYGCVEYDGSITFMNLEECLVQSACIEVSGEHAGQVVLTLSEANDEGCNDIFYGCVNTTTGKFQVEIPDDCCYEYSEYDCECFDPGRTPRYYNVTTTGVTICPGAYPDINGSYTLEHERDCYWHAHPQTLHYIDLDLIVMKLVIFGGATVKYFYCTSSYCDIIGSSGNDWTAEDSWCDGGGHIDAYGGNSSWEPI